MNAPANSADRVGFLDYLRIFAFASVFFGHKAAGALGEFIATTQWRPAALAGRALMPFIVGGGAGVVVFFLVSGYIIHSTLARTPPGVFAVKRIFRIYPLYVVAVLLESAMAWRSGSGPTLQHLLPQLLLVGDLFGTPYALGGVEWTLRIEMAFYLLMALFKAAGLIDARSKWLPHVLIAMTLACAALAPIPAAHAWATGYLTLYMPFLFVGCAVSAFERGTLPAPWLALVGAVIYGQYYVLLARLQPRWLGEPFALIALVVFLVAWLLRHRAHANRTVLFLSGLTYSVYLFHNWGFDYALALAQQAPLPAVAQMAAALGLFFLFCHAMTFIEQHGIGLGRQVLKRLGRAGPSPLPQPSGTAAS